MSQLSNYLEAALLGLLFNDDAMSAPDTWVSLHTADPTDAGTGAEVSGGSYARVRVYDNGSGSPDWTVAAIDGVGYSVENDDTVTFPTATASWGTVTHAAVWDAVSGGNMLMHGALDESKVIGIDDVFQIVAGSLVLSLQ